MFIFPTPSIGIWSIGRELYFIRENAASVWHLVTSGGEKVEEHAIADLTWQTMVNQFCDRMFQVNKVAVWITLKQ